jgi:hypothetical protein
VVAREADGARIVCNVVEPQRLGVSDQDTEETTAAREVADSGMRVGVDPGGKKSLQTLTGLVDDVEGGVPRVGQFRGGLHESLEKGVEGELGTKCDPCVDEHTKAIRLLGRPIHVAILALWLGW